jgi:branched-chain amino acid transport system ATP-binding protein
MTATVLEILDVTRRFEGLVAVDSVTTRIIAGEIRGVIGPNGAGKTTLLNLIGGQLSPTSGRILLNGNEVNGLRADRRAALGLSRTFQNLKLFREMTVLENVMVGLHAVTRAEVTQAVLRTPSQRREEARMIEESRRALALVGLTDYADASAASLAYGHRRLLEIARAIVSRPQVLLLDEPAAGLNGAEAADLVGLIERISAEGATIILVEHHMDVVMASSHKISVLNYGRLLAEGSPEEIQNHPDVIEAYLGRGDLYGQLISHA